MQSETETSPRPFHTKSTPSRAFTTWHTGYCVSNHLTVFCHFFCFVLWHFCNGQVDFVRLFTMLPSPAPPAIWLNNTGCTKFSTIISLCNVWMLWICVNNFFKTHRHPPPPPAPQLPHYTPSKKNILLYFLNIYNLLSKSGLWNWDLPPPPPLLLCSDVGSRPTSAAIFAPNWVAGMADRKQCALRNSTRANKS